MEQGKWKKALLFAGGILALWLGIKYLLPVAAPFLLGLVISLLAEPGVAALEKRLQFPRGLAAGVGISLSLVLLVGVVSLIGAVAVRQVGSLANRLPGLVESAGEGMVVLQDYLLSAAEKAPQRLQPALQKTVVEFFGDGSALTRQIAQRLPGALTGVLGAVPDGLLGAGTAVMASFLFSARLPRIKAFLKSKLPPAWNDRWKPALMRVKKALLLFVKAQGKLCLITFGILAVGFSLLGISNGILWAALVAVVDAVPLLGTGTVLLPWAAVRFLQGAGYQGVGLLCLYAAAAITRTLLEPRLVGRQLGLDPLLTLGAMYAGYRFWGFLGLLLAPVLAAAAKGVISSLQKQENP